ncbi:hypothetical protein [Streptomyces poriticola]|uniref:hypothetical protein n=1 Tax=Streptomyces poriticola TaxID=3120506 RepID=UPI002FCDF167
MSRRPALRMCTRCERMTDEPVVVHEVHAATGPGFNIYACPDCAPHYPPMTDPLDLIESARHHSRLTLHADRAEAEATPPDDEATTGPHTSPLTSPAPCATAHPPCNCRRCTTQTQ